MTQTVAEGFWNDTKTYNDKIALDGIEHRYAGQQGPSFETKLRKQGSVSAVASLPGIAAL